MNLLRRVLSAAVLVPLLGLLVWYAPAWLFTGFLLVVVLLATGEWWAMTGLARGTRVAALPLLAVLPPGLHAAGDRFWGPWLLALLLTAAGIGVWRRGEPGERMAAVRSAALGALFVAAPLSCFVLLRDREGGRGLVLFLLVTVWLVDTAAYAAGMTLGRHPLSPVLSPRKTVEGLAGGVAAGALGGAALAGPLLWAGPWAGALGGATLALLGQLGDLFESLWKRAAGTKDSGDIIPGHGGMLDRVDSFLLTAPALYYGWLLLEAWG